MPDSSLTDAAAASSAIRRRLTRPIPLWIACLATTLGLAGGLAWARANPPAPQPETLTGVVTWSNTDTRLIAFEADGEPRDPELGDNFYHVLSTTWQDVNGQMHGFGYPTCLGGGPETVTLERHRIQLTAIRNVIHPRHNVALTIRCLD